MLLNISTDFHALQGLTLENVEMDKFYEIIFTIHFGVPEQAIKTCRKRMWQTFQNGKKEQNEAKE